MKRSKEAFLEVVRNTPLVSIDLIVHDRAGRILVGRRVNEPARGTWFVPGGSIRKNETLAQALARISADELGSALGMSDVRFAGVYEHFYDTNFAEVAGVTTHYVVLAYVAQRPFDLSELPADQHSAWTWLTEPLMPDAHPNTLAYLNID
ncbi:MAG: NUDIX domain-containing protein [Pseudomonadota bacterium]